MRPPPRTQYWPVLVAALISLFAPIWVPGLLATSLVLVAIVWGVALIGMHLINKSAMERWQREENELQQQWNQPRAPIFYKPQPTPQQQAQAGQEYQAMLEARRNARDK